MKLRIKGAGLLALAALAFEPAAGAQLSEADFTRCAAIAVQQERLSCFDSLAESYEIPVGEKRNSTAGEASMWILDDSQPDRTSLSLTASAAPAASPPDNLPVLSIACVEDALAVAIDWKAYLGGKDEVLTRIGERDAKAAPWKREAGDQITLLPDAPENFVRELLAVDRLLAQAVPFGEDPVTAVFDVRGLDNALEPVERACGL